MTTGHSDNSHVDHNHLATHTDFPSSTTYGHWSTTNYYVYTNSSAHSNDSWSIDTTGTGTYEWNKVYFDTHVAGTTPDYDYWVPVKCKCCDQDIKEKDDGLSIKMGDKEFWFHRRCFANKENSSFIRALIISTDLELLD